MLKKRMIVTGANGMLGKQAAMYFAEKYFVIALPKEELDIADYNAVVAVFDKWKPDITLNCAALRNEKCETDIINAYKVNTIGSFYLAEMSSKHRSLFVHVSSDYIFDGTYTRSYTENDQPNPKLTYALSKYYGEKLVLNINKRTFIARTAWLYGTYGNNFVHKIINNSRNNQIINVVEDQVGTPTSVYELLIMVDKLIGSEKFGIYHTVCSGQISRYGMAKKIIDLAGINCAIQPIKSKKCSHIQNTALSNHKLKRNFGYTPSSWDKALTDYILGEYMKKESYETRIY